MPPSNVARADEPLGLVRADRGSHAARRARTPGHVGDEDEPVGAEPDGERGGGLVAVHVQRPAGERRDDRDAPGGERVDDRRRARHGSGSPTSPSSGTRRRRRGRSRRRSAPARAARAPRRAPRSRRRATRATTSSAAARRHAPAADEARPGRPRRSISAVICGPAPWTTHDLVLVGASSSTCCAPPRPTAAADLDDDQAHDAVLRVDADVVVGEVGGEVRRAAGAEPEVELDPADGARRASGSAPIGAPAAKTGVPLKRSESAVRVELREAAVRRRRAGGGEHAAPVRVAAEGGRLDERRGGDPAGDRRRLGRRSPRPRPRSRAGRSRPRRRRRSAPRGRRRPRARRPRSSRRPAAQPLAPFASRTTASFVEHSPSTEMRLKLSSTAGRRNASASPGSSG